MLKKQSMFSPLAIAGLCGLCVALSTGHNATQADFISVANHSFEEPALAVGAAVWSNSGPVPGWSTTATGGFDRGVWHNPSFTGRHLNQVGFAWENNSFAQDLQHVIVANSIYTMDFLFGGYGGTGSNVPELTVEFWSGGNVNAGIVVGGTLLSSLTLTQTDQPNPNSLQEFTLNYLTPSLGGGVGQNLSIRLASSGTAGSFVSFDNIRVGYTTAVPEPGSLSLLFAATFGAASFRFRRQVSG